jgi:hypothetical protein
MLNFIKQGIMKRVFKFRTVIALAITLLAANGTFAQILTNYRNWNETSYQTINKDFRLYVRPDMVYSPAYDSVTNTGQSIDAQWTWTYLAGLTGSSATGVATANNFITFTPTVVGSYTVGVAESNTVSTCVDATPNTIIVNVINPPTGTSSINPGGAWAAITPNQSYQICGSQGAGQTVTVAFNEAVPNNIGSYSFQVTLQTELLDGANAVVGGPYAENVVQDFPLATKVKPSNLGGLTAAAFTTVTPAFTYSFTSVNLDVATLAGVGYRTRYTYRVERSTGAANANTDFVSNITQKSDLLGALTYNAFTNSLVSFIVNPAPVTGPIYHILNSYAY